MSCGSPHEVDCSEVLGMVYLFLDDEVDDATRERLRQHLAECPPCLGEYGLDRLVKELVSRCCGGDSAPAALRARVLTRIREVSQVTVTRPDGSGSYERVCQQTTVTETRILGEPPQA